MKLRTLIAGSAIATLTFFAPAHANETVKVGSTATGVPFTFLDVEKNQIQGMMVDLVQAVGEKAGFVPDVQAVDFSSLIPSLTSERIDLISAAMLITPTRKEVINFSDPVLPYGEGFVVHESFEGKISADFSELKGKVVGVQQGTVYLEKLQEVGGFKELRIYDSLADILSEVNRGRIDAGIGDGPILSYQLSKGKYDGARLHEQYESQYVGHIGVGVRKEDTALLERINAAIAELKADGTIDELAAKWGLK